MLASAAVQRWQCVISAAAAGSSAATMFPLFITHDEYFVWCGDSGGGYKDVFDLSSYKLLSGWWQCGGSALAAAQQQQAAWQRCWQRGGSGGRAVAARRRHHDNGSVAVVVVRWQRGGGQHGSGVGQCGGSAAVGSVAAVLAAWRWQHWQHAGSGRLGGCSRSLAAS